MTGPILVTGGSGTLGGLLVQRLTARGVAARVLSRRPAPAAQDVAGRDVAGQGLAGRGQVGWASGDLKTDRGIDAAVAGAEVIVHCATGLGDIGAARNLIGAARRAGRPHLVYISIVGVDRVPVGYYKSKLDVERQVADCGLPWTVLRATQFHQLILRGCEALARLPVMLVPAGTSFQPVDASDVADRLAELATGPAAGRVPDLGGPEIRPAAELARMYLQARGRRRPVLAVRLPGAAFAGYRSGAHLAPDHALGQVTFAQFLAARLGGDAQPRPGTAPTGPSGRA
jgi:uncharacterized protein YbjT (DUF2867 family)